MSTPAGVTVVARAKDGTETDVTEAVQALYDHMTGSLDWGSDFYTVEDVVPVAELAELCGFVGMEKAQRYLREARIMRRREEIMNSVKGVNWDTAHEMATEQIDAESR